MPRRPFTRAHGTLAFHNCERHPTIFPSHVYRFSSSKTSSTCVRVRVIHVPPGPDWPPGCTWVRMRTNILLDLHGYKQYAQRYSNCTILGFVHVQRFCLICMMIRSTPNDIRKQATKKVRVQRDFKGLLQTQATLCRFLY